MDETGKEWKRRNAELLQRCKTVKERSDIQKEMLVVNATLLNYNKKNLSLVTGITQEVGNSASLPISYC